jgi:hypothetical protein
MTRAARGRLQPDGFAHRPLEVRQQRGMRRAVPNFHDPPVGGRSILQRKGNEVLLIKYLE